MGANVYAKDNQIRISTSFTVSGVATDPSTVKCYYKDPTGALTTLTYGTDGALVKDSTGNYHVDIFASTPGNWWYRFEGTGSVIAASEAEFIVLSSMLV